MTMDVSAVFGDPEETDGLAGRDPALYKTSYNSGVDHNGNAVDPRGFRQSEIDARVYYLPPTISDADAAAGNFDPLTEYIPLDPSNFFFYNDTGQFVMSITCNRRKVITDEFGNEIVVDPNSAAGVFTEFKGTLLITYDDLDILVSHGDDWIRGISSKFGRSQFKFPQSVGLDRDSQATSDLWRKEHKTFKSGKYYGLSQFYVTHRVDTDNKDGDEAERILESQFDQYWNIINDANGATNPSNTTGQLKVGGFDGLTTGDTFTYNEIPTNGDTGSLGGYVTKGFGAQWLHFNVFFPQFTWAQAPESGDGGYDNRKLRTADMFTNIASTAPEQGKYYGFNSNYNIYDNLQETIGGEINTRYFANSEFYQTDFSECDKDDLLVFRNIPIKGFNNNDVYITGATLNGTYLYRTPTSIASGTLANVSTTAKDDYDGDQPVTNYYFSKGINNADCIELLFDFNLV